MTRRPLSAFAPGSWPEARRIAEVLRRETVGGALLLAAAAIALVWANSPWGDSYVALRDTTIGPSALHLNLTVGAWAADGLLAIFFFVAGLELKREFVAGDLRDPRRAAVPVVAAAAGMIVPGLLYLAIAGTTDARGWAIPIATDIAFALAVLAVVSTHLPTALRTFLLTLAVVDDLLAIVVIALFFTGQLSLVWLAAALAPLSLFAVLVQRQISRWWLLLPLAITTWAFMHASGVHATVAGVLLAFTVPVRPPRPRPRAGRTQGPDPATSATSASEIAAADGAEPTLRDRLHHLARSDSAARAVVHRTGLAEHLEHVWRPVSAGIAVPLFALFSAGVVIGGWSGLMTAVRDPIGMGVAAGLIVGKPIGILLGAALAARATRQPLQPGLTWPDVTSVGVLGGIGFTVSLLIGDLAFGGGTARADHVKIAVLGASACTALVAAGLLRLRNRRYRLLYEEEDRDENRDGIPDIYQDLDSGARGGEPGDNQPRRVAEGEADPPDRPPRDHGRPDGR